MGQGHECTVADTQGDSRDDIKFEASYLSGIPRLAPAEGREVIKQEVRNDRGLDGDRRTEVLVDSRVQQ